MGNGAALLRQCSRPSSTLPVPTIRFQILYVFLVLAHDRRRILHFGVTAHPTAEWTAQQLREAFPWDSAPRYLLRDRDQIFGKDFVDQVKAMGIKQVLSAPRSPWQRAYIERLIGTIRRECLDHVIVFSERCLSASTPKLRWGITTALAHTSRCRRTARSRGRSRRQTLDASSPFRCSAGCIIATSGAPPEQEYPPKKKEYHRRSAHDQRGLPLAPGLTTNDSSLGD